MFDPRLLGVSRGLPVTGLARHPRPWARAGLTMAAPTGLLLFISDATTLATNPALQAKLVALGLGILNALVFHWRTISTVTPGTATPRRRRPRGSPCWCRSRRGPRRWRWGA